MFRNLIVPIFVLLTIPALAFGRANVQEQVFVFDEHRFFLETLRGHAELTLDHPSKLGYEVYGPAGMDQQLIQLNIPFLRVENKAKLIPDYPSFIEVEQSLRNLAQQYPNIMNLFSIGQSTDGRDLYVMKISDNPLLDEVEPEFKYISSMHGNEITGRGLMLRLIAGIGDGYVNNDAQITQLVDNTEIFIMVSMNPDGSEARQRGNSRWADLNRDFPDFSTSDNQNTPDGREAETQAVMRFQDARNFALSANFHGGAEVVNYPWDTIEERHPFDQLIRQFSLNYTALVPYMQRSGQFPDGVTNGWDWYTLDGGMQDWSYYWYGDLQVTIELSNRKWPDYSDIPEFYRENKAALLNYIAEVHQGAGLHIDSTVEVSGDVTIFKLQGEVEENLGNYPIRNSEFFKVFDPGSYRFQVEVSGQQQSYPVEIRSNEVRRNGNYIRLIK